MKNYQPSYYEAFKCVASECTDTCCRFWQVELDKQAADKYTALTDNIEISNRIKKAFSVTKKTFKNKTNGDCPFLNERLLCDLHMAVGHDDLPRTCRIYPRFLNVFGGYEERGLSFSCPAAAKLIFNGNFEFEELENDLPITDYTDVNAELFYAVRDARNRLIDFISASSLRIDEMIAAILHFSELVQTKIDFDSYSEIEDITPCAARKTVEITADEKLRIKAIREHLRFKCLRASWRTELSNALNNTAENDVSALKIWLIYFIYRYAINAVYDKEFLAKIKASILSFLVISSLGLSCEEAMQKYSKEVEHNEYNIDRLFKLASKIKL